MKKKVLLITLSIAIILVGLLGYTYALWTANKIQTSNNILKSGCFKLEITDEQNNINLQNTIPLTNEEGMKLTPYTFKVSNTCTTAASYEVNLESLVSSTLDSSFVRLSLNANDSKLLTEYELNSSTIISDAKEGRMLDSGVLKAGKSKQYSLRVWLDGNTTATSTVIGKTLSSKITLTGSLNPNYITVNLDPMGGELATTTIDILHGDKYYNLPVPTKEGYYFNYWYLENEDNKITTSTTVEREAGHTLKASWIREDEAVILEENFFLEVDTDVKLAVTAIRPYTGEFTQNILDNASVISTSKSPKKAYGWVSGTTLYYKGETPYIYMTKDSFGDYYDSAYTKAFKNAEVIDLSGINTSLMTSMIALFYNCESLRELNISNFNTSNVQYMGYMFYKCKSLSSLDLSHFNTSKTTATYSMFQACTSLTDLDIHNFDTSNIINYSYMFYACLGLTSLDVSFFDTSSAQRMDWMFANCPGLTELDLLNFDISNATNIEQMFSDSTNLRELNLTSFDTSNVKKMGGLFARCKNLERVNLSSFNTENVTSLVGLFTNCEKLKSVDLSNFVTTKVTSLSSMFTNCVSLKYIDLSNFDTTKVTNTSEMFRGCTGLTEIDLSNFNTPNLKYMYQMFEDCTNLTNLKMDNFNTASVTRMESILTNTNVTNLTLNCTTASSLKDYIDNNYLNITVSCI